MGNGVFSPPPLKPGNRRLPPPSAFSSNFLKKMQKNTLLGVNSKADNGAMTIGEVAEKYGLSTDTLRYYERIGLIPQVQRNKHGNRDYNETNCQWVQMIKCLRSAGITIEFMIEFVRLFHQGEQTRPRRKQILQEQRDLLVQRIAEMRETLKILDTKLANYDIALFEAERKLS
jgi:DNA-binding transcriptional MerR regulator